MPLIEPFTLAVEQSRLDDLRERLARARWPESETVDDWGQGVPLEQLKALCSYWQNDYDWRRCEALLNAAGQFKTKIDGVGIHFLHVRSPNPNALPLLMTHGWPGSVIEFMKVLGPLSDPAAHGGDAADAFHLVVPSLPGYGFSDKPTHAGWSLERIARAWIILMERLGYQRFVAEGGDWGAGVTLAIGEAAASGCAGIHLNVPFAQPEEADLQQLTEREAAGLARMQAFQQDEMAYMQLQATKPQTLGYGLTDSPIGQAAWIYEKFHGWTDHCGTPESILNQDEMLDNIMLYWLPAAAASSARLYWESARTLGTWKVDIPVGISQFPKDIVYGSRKWADRAYSNIIHWNELDRGGHFAAFEQPALFISELRQCFRGLRRG